MSNLMEIDIFHARILRHSLEFGTVLGYFYIAILKSHTVVKQFGFDGKSRGCLGRYVINYLLNKKPLEITWGHF